MVGQVLGSEEVEMLEAFGPDLLDDLGQSLVAKKLPGSLGSGAHGENLVGFDEVLASDDVAHAEYLDEEVNGPSALDEDGALQGQEDHSPTQHGPRG